MPQQEPLYQHLTQLHPHLALSAEQIAAEPALAAAYVAARWQDAEHMLAGLTWTPYLNGKIVRARLFHSGLDVRHELVPATLHAGACWGEILDTRDPEADPVVCATYECFMAFVLKRFG
jgi:hypothetical protein